jgi:anti-sigma-K factor RskA
MAGFEDRDGPAAEYVLGTLSMAERDELEAALAVDANLRELVESWEKRLAPLALALEPVAVPDHVRKRIMEAIPGAINVIRLERRVKLWRGLAIGAWAAASALAGVLILRPAQVPEAGRYVAVLQSEGPGPAFVASVDLATGTISVRPVAAKTPAGKSYELWAAGAGREKPQSLGVIQGNFRIPVSRLGRLDKPALDDTIFAISLEPEGGSPTGQVTGPVLFTGKLVATE